MNRLATRHRTPGHGLALAVALLTAVTLVAQGRPAPGERAGHGAAVPFRVGETLQYDISWSSFLTAGTATVQVRERKASYDSVAYYVTAEGRPTSFVASLYPLYYKADSLVDIYTLLPQRASIFSREAGRQQMKETLFDQRRHRATFTIAANRGREFAIPAGTQDPLSALFWLRTLQMKTGLRVTLPVSFNGSVYRVEMMVAGREPIGNRRAWRVTPVSPAGADEAVPRKMVLWISDDGRRVPIRMDVQLAVGTFELILRGES